MAIADVVHQIHWPTLSLKHEMILTLLGLKTRRFSNLALPVVVFIELLLTFLGVSITANIRRGFSAWGVPNTPSHLPAYAHYSLSL
jgi:hypothetical protein